MLSAGASVIDITAPDGFPMAGYGARVGVAGGVHDPLYVRTLVLDDGQSRIVFAICDFVGVGRAMVQRCRELIAAESGIPSSHVCVAATHTHSGPLITSGDGGPAYLNRTAQAVARSVRVALKSMVPVVLKVGTAGLTTMSQNRRNPDGPIETVVRVLLASAVGGGAVASIVNYGCHATVLEHDNLLYSADFPGVAVELVEHAVGGRCLYMQGACGDVNPAWMRHDFAEVRRVGSILGGAAVRTLSELAASGERQSCINLSWSEEVPVEPAPGALLSDVVLGAAQRYIEVPRKVLPPVAEIEREVAGLERRLLALEPGDREGRRTIRPLLNRARLDLQAKQRVPAPRSSTQVVEVQAFRLSAQAAIVMLPGEFFVQSGKEIERRAGVEQLFICGYANDYAGYFAPESEFPRGGYEVGSTRFEAQAEAMITSAAVELLASLYGRQA